MRVTWPEALALYEHNLRATGRPRHRRMRAVRRLVDRLAPDGRLPSPASMTPGDLGAHVCELVAGGTPARRIERAVSALREFFALLGQLGLLDHDPSAGLVPRRVRVRRRRPVLRHRVVHRLLERADRRIALAARDRAILHLLAISGLRAAELLALDVEQIDNEARDFVVVGLGARRGRLLPLTRSTYEALANYLDHARPVLASAAHRATRALLLTSHGRRLRREHLERVLARLGAEVGLATALTPALLRRTLAVELRRGGLGLDDVRLVLGHRRVATTATVLRSVAHEPGAALGAREPR